MAQRVGMSLDNKDVAPREVIQFSAEGGERALNMWKRYVARRHRKQHERIDAERAREKALAGQDVEEAVRNVAQGSAGAQQGMYGHGT